MRLANKRENLNQGEIKIRILAYLYNRNTSVNAYTIQHKANIPLQEFSRLRGFLEDLCEKTLLERIEEETSGNKPRTNYIITDKGRTTVDVYRNSNLQDIFGNIDNLFE